MEWKNSCYCYRNNKYTIVLVFKDDKSDVKQDVITKICTGADCPLPEVGNVKKDTIGKETCLYQCLYHC